MSEEIKIEPEIKIKEKSGKRIIISETPKVEIVLLPGATMPQWAPGLPAGLDLFINEDVRIPGKGHKLVKTGVKMQIPSDYAGYIQERSGVSLRTSLSIKAGVIDPDYRGEIGIIFQNISDFPVDIKSGEKLAQMVFHKRNQLPIKNVTDTGFTIPNTIRGEAGFGSTDKN